MSKENTPSENNLETKETLRKVSTIQTYIWNSLPNITTKVLEGENPKAINDFMEKYAGKLGPDGEKITETEAEEMYQDYTEICSLIGSEVTSQEELLTDSMEEQRFAKNVQEYVYSLLPNISQKTLPDPEEKKNFDTFLQNYGNKIEPGVANVTALEAHELYDEFRKIAANYYEMPDADEIALR